MAANAQIGNEFIVRVESLLEELKKIFQEVDPEVVIEDFPVRIEEGESEVYEAPAAKFTMSDGKVLTAMPIGRELIGAEGRVDLLGERVGSESLMYLREDGPYVESTVEGDIPRRTYLLTPRPKEGWAWIPRQLRKWKPIDKETIETLLGRLR